MQSKTLRPYQRDGAEKAVNVLDETGLVYITAEVRTGKTCVSLEVARLYGATKVLFLTKKKAISSIEKDYLDFGYDKYFEILVTNDESMHKIDRPSTFDLIVHDEHSRFGVLRKPGQAIQLYRKLFFDKPMIFLSGTPFAEGYSMAFHQFWVSPYSPWSRYKNFYQWAKDYVDVKQKIINSFPKNDYSHAIEEKVKRDIEPYMVTFTQEQAGFTSKINEHILEVEMTEMTYRLCSKLKKDKVIEGKEEVILADTGAKMMQKLHQLYSGTVKFESGNRKVLDDSKARYIKTYFKGQKIAIFYLFIAELDCLKSVFGNDLTTDFDEFNSSDKSYAVQIQSGSMGISLREAESLVFYNIAFSATHYWQARDRLTTMDRLENNVYFVFARKGIEYKVHKAVMAKKDFTLSIFRSEED